MTVRCPDGHLSAADDYCDRCGIVIPAAVPAPVAPAGCPACGHPREEGEAFCEVCGYDFAAGAPSTAVTAVPIPVAPVAGRPAPTVVWTAEVDADRAFYDKARFEVAGDLPFPGSYPRRVFTLEREQTVIGRHSASRGIHPEIDLAGAPEDRAVSRAHAVLTLAADGTLTLVDPGSANGTWLNDAAEPVAAGEPVPLTDGDRVYLGAWTRVTLRKT